MILLPVHNITVVRATNCTGQALLQNNETGDYKYWYAFVGFGVKLASFGLKFSVVVDDVKEIESNRKRNFIFLSRDNCSNNLTSD